MIKTFDGVCVFVVVPHGYKVWDLYVPDGSGWEIATSNGIDEDALAKGANTLAHGSPWVILAFSHPNHEETEFRLSSDDCPRVQILEEARQSWIQRKRPQEPHGVLVLMAVRERGSPGKDPLYNLYTPTPIGWEMASASVLLFDSLSPAATVLLARTQSKHWVILGFGGMCHSTTDFRLHSPRCPSLSSIDETLERARQSWILRNQAEQSHSPPATPEPEPKKEEAEIVRRGFCEEEATGSTRYPHCGHHVNVALAHVRRLQTGGLVDCPETRSESMRFVARESAAIDAKRAALTGYCTQNDLAQGARPTVTERAFKDGRILEEIPLAGQTPHYEWP